MYLNERSKKYAGEIDSYFKLKAVYAVVEPHTSGIERSDCRLVSAIVEVT